MTVVVTIEQEELIKYVLDSMPIFISCAPADALHLFCICRDRLAGGVVVRHQQDVRAMLGQCQVTRIGHVVARVEREPSGTGHV